MMHYHLVAQNFVPNGSFEIYTQCPQTRNDGKICSNWNAPTEGTSDYFNTCAPKSQVGVSVPDNFAGSQTPLTGNAYSGIYASLNFASPFLEYREYMQVTLDSLLIAGGKYTFTMYLSLGDRSNFASNKMGAYISKTRPTSNSDTYLNVIPQIVTNTYVMDKTNWVKVTGEYIATGGEKYITIGVFEPAATHTRVSVTGGSNQSNYNGVAYYYIDDVSLTRACDIPNTSFLKDTTLCIQGGAPLLITASDTGNHSYLWNTGATTKTINALTTGKYILKVSSMFCSVYDTVTVTRNFFPVVNLGPDIAICNDIDTLLHANNPGAIYLWNTGAQTQTIRVAASGDYYVKVTNNGCVTTDTVSVVVFAPPVLQLGNDTGYCFQKAVIVNSPVSADVYLWSTGSTEPAIAVNKSGTYWLEIQKSYCTVRDSIQFTQRLIPVLNLGPDRTICKEQSVSIDITQAQVSNQWNDGIHSSIRTISAPGVFAVTATSDDGCSVSDSLVLDTFVSPVIQLGADTFICKNTEIGLGVKEQYQTYKWQNGATTSTYIATSNGTYSLEVTDQNGCRASDEIVLKVMPLPIVKLQSEMRICDPDTFVQVTGNFSSLLWNDGTSDAVFPVTAYGTFTVTVSDTNACTDKASMTVVNNCPGKIYVPNVFTPANHDGLNDEFYPVTQNIETITFQVYNRWGEKLFETHKLLEGWNGLFDSKPVPADVYVYTVQYKTFGGVMGSEAGNVTVLK